jgi:hypothetical protein
MDDLIGRLVANAGVDRAAAEQAVGIILQFLMKEGPTEKVRVLIESVPGADAAVLASPPGSSSLNRFGAIAGLTGVGSQMMATGPSVGQIQTVAPETLNFARENAGKTQSARSSARSPASASSLDA